MGGTQHVNYDHSGSASSMGSDDKNANDENDFEYEFQSSDPDVIATNIIIYRQKLKMVVHRLMNYGSTIVLLKGHCLYMRGWWRLSRGYLKKALADFRTVINPATQSPRTMTVRASLLLKTLSH